MENINTFFKCLFVLLLVSDATFSEKIVASTLAELQNSGWRISGSNPAIFEKPGIWSNYLEPLDSGVTACEAWQVTSTLSATKFLFSMPSNLCDYSRVKLHVRYFSENSVLFVRPCEFEPGNLGCYGDPGNYTEVVWQEATFTLNAIEIKNGAEIEISTNIVPSEGYIFFDQITIEHNGEACENTTTTTTTSTEITTQEPTTPEFEPTTSTFNPSTIETTTLETTTFTDISTRPPPECSTTPNPDPCDCCDRCSSKVIQEIHNHYHGDGDHHHHYYYPVADASQNEK